MASNNKRKTAVIPENQVNPVKNILPPEKYDTYGVTEKNAKIVAIIATPKVTAIAPPIM